MDLDDFGMASEDAPPLEPSSFIIDLGLAPCIKKKYLLDPPFHKLLLHLVAVAIFMICVPSVMVCIGLSLATEIQTLHFPQDSSCVNKFKSAEQTSNPIHMFGNVRHRLAHWIDDDWLCSGWVMEFQ